MVTFLASVAATGRILDLGVGSSVDEIRSILGEPGVSDRNKRRLRLDYGLVEFGLFDGRCEMLAIQVHRLSSGSSSVVPDRLMKLIVDIPKFVKFADVQQEIHAYGGCVLEGPRQTGFRCYRVESTKVELFATDNPENSAGLHGNENLWSIIVSKEASK